MSNAGGRLNTLDRIEQRAQGIIDPARSYESASECGKCARDVLALVNIARAAQVVNGNGTGEFDTRTTAALFPLRDALAALSVLGDKEHRT